MTEKELLETVNKSLPEVEHTGGEGWSILHGSSLQLCRCLAPGSFDAIITDPPYASGGSTQRDKRQDPVKKYSSVIGEKAFPSFESDQMDSLSWLLWCTAWLSDVRSLCKPGGILCVFIDFRMAPLLSVALQWAGWLWRGQVVWDKSNSRPQKGRFRQQSEYVLWASNGALPLDRGVGCLPGVYRYANPQHRTHLTEKPLQLMRDIVKITPPGGRILDPFAGAGTTVLAARLEGYEAVGIELSDTYYALGSQRVKEALEKEASG